MAFKKWVVHSPDKELAKRLAEECEVDPFAAMVACGRGCTDAAELEQFLAEEPLLCDPHELVDIEKAAAALKDAVSADLLIAVFGDYDCDGVTSTALLYDYLTTLGARVVCYIPERSGEGYGMSCSAVDKLNAMGVQFIVTVDNGIGCAEEIAYAASLGIRTVVTDHHIPPAVLPEAEAVVDPHRADCPSSFKEICGVEVAFKLVCVLEGAEPEQLLGRYADLLAIGTVADVMPLINENRSIVREGIRRIRTSPRTGISAVLSVAGIDRDSVNAGRIAFGIVPRINAAGRMGSAERALKLLTSTNMLEALGIAGEIDDDNAKRQTTEKQIVAEACAVIEKNGYQYHRVIVVSGEGWHHGVIGIVASRIMEKYGKPAIVIAEDGETAQGSGRSYHGFSLYKAISACAECLLKFGGHELAAGIGIETAKIGQFRQKINEFARQSAYIPPELSIDFRINPTAMTVDMVDALKALEPFGTGNPTPVFGIFGVKLEKINPIGGGKHLKLLFSRNGTVFQTLLFGVTADQFCFATGDALDLAVTLDSNLYQGLYTLSVQIRALRMSGTDDELLFSQLSGYHDYLCGGKTETSVLLPSREEAGEIYRQLVKNPASTERIKYMFLIRPGYAKTQIAVTAFSELGLIRNDNGMLRAVTGAAKTDLMNSKTYRELAGQEGRV